jgi:phosphate transport system protein
MWKDFLNIFRKSDLFTQALEESYAMLDLDLSMFEASVETLRRSDHSQVALDVYALDKRINAYEREVRRKVFTHLLVSGTHHLSSGLILASIVIDIERIGDYAKNIFDLARSHPTRLHGASLEPEVGAIETQVDDIFRKTVRAFRAGDADQARLVMASYKETLSASCESIVTRIVAGQVSDLSAAEAAAVALYVRYLKRIAAHSSNIGTSLVNPFHRLGYKEKRGSTESDVNH